MTFEEFLKQYPEYCKTEKKEEKQKKRKRKYKFLCQCKGNGAGHIFDYRDRERFPEEDHHAPCQGKCPICGSEDWSLIIGQWPIKFNFTS